MNPTPAKILVIEDEPGIREPLLDALRGEGYTCLAAGDGKTGLALARGEAPDLVILDLMLPGMDGFAVCRKLRAESAVPVLILSARDGESDQVLGFELGADDYVTKPFSLQEVVARVRAALRRVRATQERMADPQGDDDAPIEVGELRIDPARHEVWLRDEPVHLTVREFDLLLFLARNPERPFTRSQLLERIWGITYEGYDRTIDSHVQRLRAKIEADPGSPTYVRTVWGVGYKFSGDEV